MQAARRFDRDHLLAGVCGKHLLQRRDPRPRDRQRDRLLQKPVAVADPDPVHHLPRIHSNDHRRRIQGNLQQAHELPPCERTRPESSQLQLTTYQLWHVEQSFRMSKTDLRARPMFHRTRDAIEAHLTILFTALATSREVQARTGLAIRNVIKQLRPLRSATIAINDTKQTFAPHIPAEKQAILDATHGTKLTH